jgi:hypothetical protein
MATIDAAPPGVLHRAPWMADVAQLVERQVVVLDVVGSKPIVRPRFPFFVPVFRVGSRVA